MVSVYFSYAGEFADMSDEERFQWVVNWDKQKALQAKRLVFIDANPEKMRKLWDGIDRKYHDKRQKECDERSIYNNNKTVTTKTRATIAKSTIQPKPPEERGVQLDDPAIQEICSIVAPFEEGLLYNVFGFFHKHDISSASCIKIIETLTKDEEERRYKRNILEQIYRNTYPGTKDVTSKHLLDILTKTFGYGTAKKILEGIVVLLIGTQEPVKWLTDSIMREYICAMMDDNDEIYYYDNNNGIFVKGGNTVIKKQIELLYRNATTYKVHEITNHIRRTTYVSRSDFDSNIDILNTDNCTLTYTHLKQDPIRLITCHW